MDLNYIKTNIDRILIYGYGREGKSTYRFLSRRFPKKHIRIFDEDPFRVPDSIGCPKSDTVPPCLQSKGECHVDLIVVSPGIDRKKIAHLKNVHCTSNTEIFFSSLPEEKRKNLIGISGTKGKSTTVKFCAEVLQKAEKSTAIGGNYGVPLLDLYDDYLSGKYEYVVTELSSFQLENLQISPGYAIFLNFFPDHLDRHKTEENYFSAKENLWRHQKSTDYCITSEYSKGVCKKTHIPSQCCPAPPLEEHYFPPQSIFRAPHIRANFGTIRILLKLLNINPQAIERTARTFQGLPHRLELFTTKEQITFINDAISTNPDCTRINVQHFGSKLGSIILGGQDRMSDFTPLIQNLKTLGVQIIILDSEISSQLTKTCHELGLTQPHQAQNLDHAVELAFRHTPPHKICLLSTAAPSFGLFQNFEEQGDAFKRLVMAY